MPTVTSQNKDEFDREFMEKRGLLNVDLSGDCRGMQAVTGLLKHGQALRTLGFISNANTSTRALEISFTKPMSLTEITR
jgi:hypothetical protein